MHRPAVGRQTGVQAAAHGCHVHAGLLHGPICHNASDLNTTKLFACRSNRFHRQIKKVGSFLLTEERRDFSHRLSFVLDFAYQAAMTAVCIPLYPIQV
jgi:hypothetical protein